MEFEDAIASAAAQALVDAFGVAFELWSPGACWESDGRRAGAELAARLDEAAGGTAPVVWPRGDRQLLAVPIVCHGKVALVATHEFNQISAEWLLSYGRLFLREFGQRERIDRLEGENEAIALRIQDGLEELTFMRQMTEELEVSDLTSDLPEMAAKLLPLLQQSVEAQSLVLVHGNGKRRRPPVWAGPEIASDKACRTLIRRYRHVTREHPVVQNHFDAAELGVELAQIQSFILVPVSKAGRVAGWLLAFNRINASGISPDELPWPLSCLEFGTSEATLLSSAASILAAHAYNVALFHEKEQLLTQVVFALVSAIEAKDGYTSGHSERVALFSKRLAEELGLEQEARERIYLTGLLHDVGKIGISDATLNKPGRLSEEEFSEVMRHPDQGWAILHDLDQLRYVLPGVLYHHERFDGSGYPDGLAGDEIPLDGRILAVSDAYDAMTSDRPYRQGMSHAHAETVLRNGAGTQWDPQVVAAFFRIVNDVQAIRAAYQPRLAPQRMPRSLRASIANS